MRGKRGGERKFSWVAASRAMLGIVDFRRDGARAGGCCVNPCRRTEKWDIGHDIVVLT